MKRGGVGPFSTFVRRRCAISQPVWVLSVDLQTKTATFQSGLSDAARSARGAFTDIKSGASEMGKETGYSMMEARHSVMLLGEEFGVHLPRAVASFIASIGPLGTILEAAFPFLAIIAGATILIEHLQKLHEAGEKLTADQLGFATAANNALNQFDQKILQAQIRSDELRNDHLSALKHEIELLDKTSLEDLIHSFDEVAKSAEPVLKGLEASWYTVGKGSQGAEHSLADFIGQYKNLQSMGDDKGASALLDRKITREQQILDALKDKQSFDNSSAPDDTTYQKGVAAAKTLEEYNVKTGLSLKDQIAAHEELNRTLTNFLALEEQKATLLDKDTKNTQRASANEQSAQAAAAAREHAGSLQRLGQMALNADKATADARLSISRASLEERLQVEMEFAAKERDLQLQGNDAEIAALDKSGKDYANQLKALEDKALEIRADYAAKTTELQAQSSSQIAARDLAATEQGEREKIEATQKGTAERLSVIDDGIRWEEALQLQSTDFFKELLNQRAQAAQEEAAREQQIADQKLEAQIDGAQKAAEEEIKYRTAQISGADGASGGLQDIRRVEQERQIAEMSYQLQKEALQKELQLYEQMGDAKIKEARQVQQAIELIDKQHADKSAELDMQQAEATRNALAQIGNSYAQTFLQIAEGHQSLTKTMIKLTDQALSNFIKSAIEMMAKDKESQLSHAKAAAAGAANAVSNIPIVGPVLAPIAAAAVFAGAMAFEEGGIVPGVGRGDVVPAMLTPGEGVVPGGVMDGLQRMALNGGFEQRPTYHVVVHQTLHAQSMDADGVGAVLQKHGEQFQQHFERTLRRLNR